ncbi:MAG: 16S rRNA (uracil(1498)-N(3))-methyltransferase [Actinobacteria bacterium]|nr:MAG: 16S rRNA (uracil(1498)-N(3))-methyltransferase [Actinomycetota bacterium]
MSRHRFFLTGPVGDDGVLPLSDRDLHHARDVLRLRAGEEIAAVEPGGRVLAARVAEEPAAGMRVEVVGELPGESGLHVWLVCGVCKGERTDLAVRMAVEVGAAGVVPVLTERTVVRLEGDKLRARGDRWRRIAEEAAKQSGRAFVPYVADPVELSFVRDALPGCTRVLVPWEEAGEGARGVRGALESLGTIVPTNPRSAEEARDAGDAGVVAVVVGPEGGLTDGEVALLESEGAVTCTLGPIVLRSETAAVVALALVLHELGGLGGA